MGLEINTQTSFLGDIIITGLSSFGWRERKMVRGPVRENATVEESPVNISLHLHLYPPSPLIPLLAGQCLCSDLLKNETKDFFFSFLFSFFFKMVTPERREAGSNETRPCGH